MPIPWVVSELAAKGRKFRTTWIDYGRTGRGALLHRPGQGDVARIGGFERAHWPQGNALLTNIVNVLWALLRDRRCYELTPPKALAA